jgi:hypothetical protein
MASKRECAAGPFDRFMQVAEPEHIAGKAMRTAIAENYGGLPL